MKRHWLLTLILGAVLSLGFAPEAKSYRAERFDVDIQIEPGGSLWVTETVSFRFEGGPFTYVFRELSADYTDGVADIEALLDGAALPHGDQPGEAEIAGTNPVRVTWYFEPSSDATKTFTLNYRLLGAIRREGEADVLYHYLLPESYEYSIAASTTTVRFPAGASLLQAPVLAAGEGQVSSGPGGVRVVGGPLAPGSPLILELRFPAGAILTTLPAWQHQATQPASAGNTMRTLVPVLAGIWLFLAFAAILLGALRRWEQRSQTPRWSQPPAVLPPAIAAALVAQGSRQGWSALLATLFDLARRGVVRVEEVRKGGAFRGREFVFHRERETDELRPHEQELLNRLFLTRRGPRSQISSRELPSIAGRSRGFASSVEQELLDAGWLDPENRRRGNSTRWLAVAIFLAGWIALLPASSMADVAALLSVMVGIALQVGGAALWLLSFRYSRLTEEGQMASRRWAGFSLHLSDAARGRTNIDAADFEVLLPYATAFGMSVPWVRRFQKRGGIQPPAWFTPLADPDQGGYDAFAALVSDSSSAGAAGDGGAGAGASGGGASGAG
jgi:uncharacterized membrane protein YgcG